MGRCEKVPKFDFQIQEKVEISIACAGRNLNGLSFIVLKSYLNAAFRDQVSIGNSSFWYKLDRALIGSLIKSSYKSFVNL